VASLSGVLVGSPLGASIRVQISSKTFSEVCDMVIDYTAIADGITAQLGTAVPAALVILGVILGITIGVKVFKRFAK
jgi:hypothetical protein